MDKEVAVAEESLLENLPAPRRGGPAKGSKNKITLLKLMAEEAARDRNADRLQYVIDQVIVRAAQGDATCQKLVWNAVMSQGVNNEQKAAEKLQINIGNTYQEPLAPTQGLKEPDIVIIPTDVTEEVLDENESQGSNQ